MSMTRPLLLLASLLIAACGSPARDELTLPTAPTSTVPVGTDFTLAPGESVSVDNAALTLVFTKVVGDSRCPSQMTILCVWAGSVVTSMRVNSTSGARDVTLETQASRDMIVVGDYLVQLVGVTPARLTLDTIPPTAYRATLRINRK